jgi:DNA polymerase
LQAEIAELRPKVIFILGKQAAGFVLSKLDIQEFNLAKNFNYRVFVHNNISYIPIHHPSFILVYKRKQMNLYVHALQKIVKKILLAFSV